MHQITTQSVLSISFTTDALAQRATYPEIRTVLLNKPESKVVLVYAMKEYSGSGGIAPLILNLSTTRRSMVTFTPQPFYTREITPVPIE
jgi:hypothetical protein